MEKWFLIMRKCWVHFELVCQSIERFLRFLRETGVLINLFQLLNKGSSNLDLLCHLIMKKKRIIFINHAHENTFVLA
jgi:selenocysteine lyase/cysteine desulfurase